MNITGGCHCGKITYEAKINIDNVVICHCTDCQKLSGAAFRTVVFSEEGTFKLKTGEPQVYVKTVDGGIERGQTFCTHCGSPIYSTSVGDDPNKIYGIRLGTVDQRNMITPNKQKWIGSSHSWTQEICVLPLTDKK